MRIPRLRSSTPDGFMLQANDDDDDDDDNDEDDDDEDDGGLRNLSRRMTRVASASAEGSKLGVPGIYYNRKSRLSEALHALLWKR